MFSLAVVLSLLSLAWAFTETYEERIVGGRTASISEVKHQVSLQHAGSHFCGGAIISPKIVISASHCFKYFDETYLEDMTVRLGSSHRSSGGVVKNVDYYIMHPQFHRYTLENDVALVKLKSAVIPSAVIQFIPLTSHTPEDGTLCMISGWGMEKDGDIDSPEVLKLAEVKIVSNERCRSSEFGYGEEDIMPNTICANAAGQDSCQGDSGGPMISDGELVGIVSFGIGCGSSKFPGVYADVSFYKAWVLDKIRTM